MFHRFIFYKVIMLYIFSIYGFCQLVQITSGTVNEYHPKWSINGDTIAYTQNVGSQSSIWLIPAGGGDATQVPIGRNGDLGFVWSPDGKKMVFDGFANNTQPPYNLYIYSFETNVTTLLTNISVSEIHPTWSPDGSTIAFCRDYNGIYSVPAVGGAVSAVTSGQGEDWHPAWSPDGSKIAFTSDRSGNSDLWTIRLSDGNLQQLTNYSGYDDRAAWSPDGTMLAFASDRAGNDDIWIYHFSDGSVEQFTNNSSFDSHPDWSPDGTKIAFASERNGNFDVWVKTYEITGIDLNDSSTPDEFILRQNYPNPFNPETTISFEIKKSCQVNLKIFNLNGQLIRTLLDKFKTFGIYQEKWNGRDDFGNKVPSGVYFYQLNSENYEQSKKMILLQ